MSTITRKIVSTNKAAQPVGLYSQAIIADRTVYVSGCLGLNKDTTKLVEGGPGAEAAAALENLKAILLEAGSSVENVVKITIFVVNIADFGAINEEYKKVFAKDLPARSSIQVSKLPLDGKVEIEAIALTGDVKTVTD